MSSPAERDELRRYVRRVGDRWPLQTAIAHRPGPSDYMVVLVSPAFDGVPWLERVRQAEALWDRTEMGTRAQVHCYTPVEFERKVQQLPPVREAAERGLTLEP